ncbi:MAG: hypothetical protein JW776_15780 [Candidatus Lokiarchaeota archaeon]|nr:hypothetical protein [Candidatus Lokiarchaeota archaeon]
MVGKKKTLFPQCPRCNLKMRIEINTEVIEVEPGSFYLIVHAHGDLDVDAHAVIIEVDNNFGIRGIRVSDIFEYTYDI